MRLQSIKRRRLSQPPKDPLRQLNPNEPQQFLQHSRRNQRHNDHEERPVGKLPRIIINVPEDLPNRANNTLDKALSRLRTAAGGGRGRGAGVDGGAFATGDSAGGIDVGV